MNQYTKNPIDFIIRFWSKVAITANPDKCWEWQSSRNKKGYGYFSCDHKTKKAHRIAWELSNGIIPNDFHILHTCDNPSCCNPSHLYLGTNRDNALDKERKGRHKPATGERHGMHKLTDKQIEEIRQRYATGGISQSKLGREYGVSAAYTGRIIRREHRK